MIYLDLESDEGFAWLQSTGPARDSAAGKYKRAKDAGSNAMPRALLEDEISQIMLRDKEAHTGRDLGAKPRYDLPFAKFTEWNAPALDEDTRPSRQQARAEYVIEQAERCAALWAAVVERAAFDTLKMWGCSRDEKRQAVMFFESPAGEWSDARDMVGQFAGIEPRHMTDFYRSGRARALAEAAIGRERWHTRMINAQATAAQPDLFYSMGAR